MNKKVCFLIRESLVPLKTKTQALHAWNSGKYFKIIGTNEYIKSNHIEFFRKNYSRIFIQYSNGIIEI